MPRYLRLVWLAMGLASMVGLVVLFLLPATWSVQRETVVAAPPEAVWPWLEDLDRWPTWSPWQEDDYEGLTYHYSSQTAGVGAEMRWDSETTGDGVLTITAADPPRRLAFTMAMQQGRIVAAETLSLEPLAGDRTRVTWLDRGELGHTLLGRLSLPVIEESMGRDLARGLENLRATVEAAVSSQPADGATVEPQRDAT